MKNYKSFSHEKIQHTQCEKFRISKEYPIYLWQIRAAPIHIEAIHIVNNSYLFNMVYSVMKPFMDDDFKRKVRNFCFSFI